MNGTSLIKRLLSDDSVSCPAALQCPRQTPGLSGTSFFLPIPSDSTSAEVYKWSIPQAFMGRELIPRNADVGGDGTCQKLGLVGDV